MGHSRFRELILGGMTQHLITQSSRLRIAVALGVNAETTTIDGIAPCINFSKKTVAVI